MNLKITDIQFDFTTEDVGENVDFEMLQDRLQNGYIHQVFVIECEDELADVISDKSGWLVKNVSYVEV
jgi:hypothetical protein